MSVWEAVVEHGRRVRFDPGDTLVTHGAGDRHRFAIDSGVVLVTATSQQGATVLRNLESDGVVRLDRGSVELTDSDR